jgi:tRNA threonylcarbamoyladenosine biosynthesis protein TsaB
MALLLSLETSTHSFSCALHRDHKLIAFDKSAELQTTAAMLAVMVDKLFIVNDVKKSELSAVIVAAGPGSYTGLRIGIATAKGICYALDIPLISVNSLQLMAMQFICRFPDLNDDALFCPMLDARRMEVYCMVTDKFLKVVEPIRALVIDNTSFEELLDQHVIYFFGEGSDKCKGIIRNSAARFFSGLVPSAQEMGAIAYEKYFKNEFENLELFEPFYLKDFIVKKPKLIS